MGTNGGNGNAVLECDGIYPRIDVANGIFEPVEPPTAVVRGRTRLSFAGGILSGDMVTSHGIA